MNTKFNIGETIYIPAKVVSINVDYNGVFYRTNFSDDIRLRYVDGPDVPENLLLKIPDDLYIEIQKRLNPKEFVELKR